MSTSLRNAGAFAIVVLLASAASGQVHEQWLTTFGADPEVFDLEVSVAFGSSGSILVAGQSGTSGPGSSNDFLTLRYDALGALVWSRRFDLGGQNDFVRDVVVDPSDDSVYVVGRGKLAGVLRAIVVKYDAAGSLLWSAVHPNAGALYENARVDASGSLVVVGGTQSDFLAVKYDALGNLVWSTTVAGSMSAGDTGRVLELDPSGDIVLGGEMNLVTGTSTDSEIGIVKLSASGALMWSCEVTGTGAGYEKVFSLAIANDGSIYAGGTLHEPGTGGDGALVKVDPSGNIVWMRMFHARSPTWAGTIDQVNVVAVAPNGNVRAAGFSSESPSGQSDVRVFEYDTAGNLVWQHVWDGPNHSDDKAQWISSEPDGSVTIGGVTRHPPSGKYSPVLLRLDAHGTLRWADIEPVAGSTQFDAAFAADGARVFAGRDYPASGPSTDIVVLLRRDQSQAFCFGDGTSGACPCANASPAGEGRGCAHSTGRGARLFDVRSASLGSDSLALVASDLPESSLAIFLQGDTALAPAAFGAGLLCLGGSVQRIFARNAAEGTAVAPRPGGPSISARSAALGAPIPVGGTRYYQVHYREPDPGFCPAPFGNGWNVSSGRSILWVQ